MIKSKLSHGPKLIASNTIPVFLILMILGSSTAKIVACGILLQVSSNALLYIQSGSRNKGGRGGINQIDQRKLSASCH